MLHRDIPHRAICKNQLFVPVPLQLGNDWVFLDRRIGGCRSIEPFQSLLNVGHIRDGGIVPHFPVIHPQERPHLYGGLELLQLAVLVLDHRPTPVLDADIRIVVFSKRNHFAFPFLNCAAGSGSEPVRAYSCCLQKHPAWKLPYLYRFLPAFRTRQYRRAGQMCF